MIWIAHRGHIGINNDVSRENSPDYIDEAISLGYDVEVDLWYHNSKFYLGHDVAQHHIDSKWMTTRFESLWIHCKTIPTLRAILNLRTNHPWIQLTYFFHQNDDCTLTSNQAIWVFPGRKLPTEYGIAVLPELYPELDIRMACGICSDYIAEYREKYKNVI